MVRYMKNKTMLTDKECALLAHKSVCVVGCGGLGGYIVEMLGRLGIGKITVVDGDDFDLTNLNRQLFATEENLGTSKVIAAQKRMEIVNSTVNFKGIKVYLTDENAYEIIKGHDLIVDALDDIATRFVLQETASKLKIPMIYGAIAGWYGQVATIMPGENLLNRIYRRHDGKGHEKSLGNPSFTPALVASIEVSEALKVLIGRGELLTGKLLLVDLLQNSVDVIDLV